MVLKKPKTGSKGKVIVAGKHQVGSSNMPKDKKRTALAPGKRVSSSGKTYYEYRKNRSDLGDDRPTMEKSEGISLKKKALNSAKNKSVKPTQTQKSPVQNKKVVKKAKESLKSKKPQVKRITVKAGQQLVLTGA